MNKFRENEINPGLMLQTVIDKAIDFGEGKISQREIGNWGKQWVIKNSIPIKEKMQILSKLVSLYQSFEIDSQEIAVCELYKNMFFYLYLEGYLGIPIIVQEDVNYTYYDLLEPLFGPWIESYAKRDIDIFKEMLNRVFELYNLNGMNSILYSLSDDTIENAVKANQELLKELGDNVQLIEDLRDIAIFNDPATSQIVKSIQESGLQQSLDNYIK